MSDNKANNTAKAKSNARAAAPAMIPYTVKTVSRARMRSALTVLGVAVSMVLFGFVRSMDRGLSALEAKVKDANMLLVFERNTF